MFRTWQECVPLAEHYIALDETEVYLHREPSAELWQMVTRVEAGSTYRLGMPTGVWFTAEHPSGLSFKWSYELESASANGKGYYEIDVPRVQRAMSLLPDAQRVALCDHLAESADKVEAQGEEYRRLAETQFASARALRSFREIQP